MSVSVGFKDRQFFTVAYEAVQPLPGQSGVFLRVFAQLTMASVSIDTATAEKRTRTVETMQTANSLIVCMENREFLSIDLSLTCA